MLKKLPSGCVAERYPLPLEKRGRAYVMRDLPRTEKQLELMDVWYPIQVKQKDKTGRPDIDAFEAVMMQRGDGLYGQGRQGKLKIFRGE